MARLDILDRTLADIEHMLDDKHRKEVEQLHLDTLNYRNVKRLPLSIMYPLDEEVRLFSYEECFYNPEKMLYNELFSSFGGIYNSVRIKDDYPLHIRSNHGLGVISSMLGAKIKIINNSMPWVEHLTDINNIKNITSKGTINIYSDLVNRVFDTYGYYKERLSKYPLCSKHIHLSQPDMQGPFDNAHLLLSTEIFYLMYDEPNLVHDLLELLTNAYIDYHCAIKPIINDDANNEAIYIHGSIYGGKAIIKDDTAVINLSKEHYMEFSHYYNKKICKSLGDVSIHYCGKALDWHCDAIYNENIKTINFGNPDLNDLDMLYDGWSKYKVPIVFWGYNSDKELLLNTVKKRMKTGISLAFIADSFEQAQDIIKSHRDGDFLRN